MPNSPKHGNSALVALVVNGEAYQAKRLMASIGPGKTERKLKEN
jgi:hypothetical protein